MLRAVGFDDGDFKKPQVGIASTWSMVTPCNMHINELADRAAEGANALWEPTETSYPSYDGKGKIRVLTSGLQDPDGFVIEVNEVLEGMPSRSKP